MMPYPWRGPSVKARRTWNSRFVMVIVSSIDISFVDILPRKAGSAVKLRWRNVRAIPPPARNAIVTEPAINGPGDYVAAHGDVALWALIDGARPLAPENAADVLRRVGLHELQG